MAIFSILLKFIYGKFSGLFLLDLALFVDVASDKNPAGTLKFGLRRRRIISVEENFEREAIL